jgi:glyoxylase-like metal-dependent hydrolase (beta-lactamase superfamily II)
MKPRRVLIRSYQVGFGDCFLFTVHYTGGENRHVLIDFGSTGLPEGVPSNRLKAIAKDIQAVTGGKLTAVVATHRHKDHISGFATNASGTGSGDIIAKLKPDIVVQPWTEDPDLEQTATAPHGSSGAPGLCRRLRSRSGLKRVAAVPWEMRSGTGSVFSARTT